MSCNASVDEHCTDVCVMQCLRGSGGVERAASDIVQPSEWTGGG